MLEGFDRTQVDLLIERIHASGVLGHGQRFYALLKYICDKQANGEGDRLKAYSIAIDVFGKSPDFDSSTDSIVRVEMGRLRSALELYFERAGASEPYVLTIPKGRYVPELNPRAEIETQKSEPALNIRRAIMSIFGVAFAAVAVAWLFYTSPLLNEFLPQCKSQRPAIIMSQGDITGGLRSDLDILGGKIEEYLAYYPLISLRSNPKTGCTGAPKYTLSLTLSGGSGHLSAEKLSAKLLNAETRTTVWSNDYPLELSQGRPALALAAAQLSFDIAYENGVVPGDALSRAWLAPQSEREYRCLMKAHRYFLAGSDSDFAVARQCLHDLFRSGNKSPDVLAYYASILQRINDDARPGKNAQTQAEMNEAISRSEFFNPNSADLLALKMRLARHKAPQDYAELNRLLNEAESKYPMQPHVLDQLAATYIVSLGNFEKGEELVKRAEKIYPTDDTIRVGKIATLLHKQEWKEASNDLLKLKSDPGFIEVLYILKISCKIHDNESLQFAKQKLNIANMHTDTKVNTKIDSSPFAAEFKNLLHISTDDCFNQ